MSDLPQLLDLHYRIQVISLGWWDDGTQSGGCGVLGLIEVGLGATLGAGMLLGIKACVLVRASTNCQAVLLSSKGHQHTLLSYTSA